MTLTAILLASTLVAVAGELSKTSEDLEARWRREYPLAAEEWETTARQFVAKGRFSFRWTNGSKTVTPDLTVASSGDKRVFIKERTKNESPGLPDRQMGSVVYVQTPERSFDLTKAPESQYYRIYNIVDYQDDDESQFNLWYTQFARNATVYFGTSLVDRMRHHSFVLKSITAPPPDGNGFVRVEYTYEGKYVVESGVVDLDPAKRWAIQSVEITCKTKKDRMAMSYKKTIEYKKINDIKFFPVHMESFNRTPNPKAYEHAVLNLDQISLGNVPDDLFRMSTYGVPDIPLSTAPPSVFTFRNPVLWLALFTTAVAFGFPVIMRLRRGQAN